MPADTELSRRRFIRLAAAAGLMAGPGTRQAWSEQPAADERAHRPLIRLPALTSNGARVPIVVDVPHAMQPDHRIVALEVVNPSDPVPLKGTFQFSAANGRAHVAFQARLDEGPSTVSATAECGRHGRFATTAPVTVAAGGGGCAGGPPSAVVLGRDELRPPVIRIPQLVAEGVIRRDDVIDVQVKTKHPNRTGLARRDGQFVRDSEPFHLREMLVFYGDEIVSRFLLTAALSDNPLISFKLRAREEASLRVTLTNTRGQRFEATHVIRFA